MEFILPAILIFCAVLAAVIAVTAARKAKKEDNERSDEKGAEKAPQRKITSSKPLFTIDDSVRMNSTEKEELKRLLGETAVFLEENAGQLDDKYPGFTVYEGETMTFSKPVHELYCEIHRQRSEDRLVLSAELKSTFQGSIGGTGLFKGTAEELLEQIRTADIEDIAEKAAVKADELDRFYDWD